MTPEQAVCGASLRWAESLNRDADEFPMSALGCDGEAWRSAQMRASAGMAMLARDASDKLPRAMMRKAPKIIGDVCPGTRVYFWGPHPMKGRARRDPHRWRSPAADRRNPSGGAAGS